MMPKHVQLHGGLVSGLPPIDHEQLITSIYVSKQLLRYNTE